jgi:hypothetical protein
LEVQKPFRGTCGAISAKSLALLLFLGVLPTSGTGWAAELYTAFPPVIHSEERCVVFAHGLIAEGDDPRPVHPVVNV